MKEAAVEADPAEDSNVVVETKTVESALDNNTAEVSFRYVELCNLYSYPPDSVSRTFYFIQYYSFMKS